MKARLDLKRACGCEVADNGNRKFDTSVSRTLFFCSCFDSLFPTFALPLFFLRLNGIIQGKLCRN